MAASCFASAQGMYRLGEGTELNAVQLIVPSGDNVLVFEITETNQYELHRYNGISLESLGVIPNIPLHEITDQENFKIVDALVLSGKLYVLGSDFGPNPTTKPNRIIEWDGSKWTDLTNDVIANASNVSKLISYNNNLTLVGIFENSGLVSMVDGTWTTVGGVLGDNRISDNVLDATTFLGKVYVTGEFTRPGTGQRYNTGVYQNGTWRPLETPPFIGKSKHFDIVNNQLILTGESNIVYDYIKSYDGSQWTDISVGLEDVIIHEFWDIAGHNSLLYLTGSFEDRQTGRRFNFISKDADGWHFGENTFQNEQIRLAEKGNEIYAYGNFNLNGIINAGELTYHSAMLTGRIYFDENNNCVFDETERGLDLVKVTVNPGEIVGYTNKYGLYEIPVGNDAYTITFEKTNGQDFGCGRLGIVNVTSATNYVAPELNVIEKPDVVDLELSSTMINGWKLVRNSYNEIKLFAHNAGTEDIEGASLSMKMGDWWKEVKITPQPTSTKEGELIWKISDLAKGETFEILISGETKVELELYNDFCFTGEVDFPQVDLFGSSNRETAEFETVDELGPISKQVDCGAWYPTNTQDITYQIRFENEADEIVNDVVVIDTFDSDLVTTGVEDYTVLGSTREVQIRMIEVPGKKQEYRMIYKWISSDANLAPAGAKDGKDVGNVIVKFRLHEYSKQKNIELCNQAQVIYDNNEPLYTNTVCSKATSLGVERNGNFISQVRFFPNPATKEITIENNSQESRIIEIRTQTGQLLFSKELVASENKVLDLTKWAKGVYILQIAGYESQKLLVH